LFHSKSNLALDEVMDYLENNKSKFVARLQEFCRQPSISTTNQGVTECALLLKKMMTEVGIEARPIEIPNGLPYVYGEISSGKAGAKTVLFYNHYDVQPPDPLQEWKFPPFGAEVHDGVVYARGVADNKGNIIARLNAIEAFIATVGDVPVNLKFMFEGDEEISSPNISSFTTQNKELLKSDVAIWSGRPVDAEGRPIVSLGNKGLLYVELRAKGAATDVHSMEAPILVNPAWRLVWALATLKGPEEKVLIDGFYDNLKPFTKEELELIEKTPFDEDERKKDREIESFLLGASGSSLKTNLLTKPTCNICGFVGGYIGRGAKTIVPSESTVKLDFRLLPNQDPDEVLQKLKTHLARHGFQDIQVEVLGKMPPSRTPLANKYVDTVVKSMEKLLGKPAVIWPNCPGSSPRYAIERLGIPVIDTGGCHSYVFSRIHSPNENITVDGYMRGMKATATLINSFGDLR